MFLIAILFYFVAACLMAGLLLFPALRERLKHGLGTTLRITANALSGVAQSLTCRMAATARFAVGRSASVKAWLVAHRRLAMASALLLALPPTLMWCFGGLDTLEGFDDAESERSSAVISALIAGEQLVPPQPLPPEVFMTTEVERLRPGLSSADRRWDLLDPEFRQRLLRVYKEMHDKHGYEMVLLEGYRSPERQASLAALGASVTSAGPWQSMHQYGRAADSAFLSNGRVVISEREPWAMRGYELYGEVARGFGLTWGGRWKNMDLGHVELPPSSANRPSGGG